LEAYVIPPFHQEQFKHAYICHISQKKVCFTANFAKF
jgi:hypothetical protein